MSEQYHQPYTRPLLKRHEPKRSAALLYRTSVEGEAIGGVPLDSVENAVAAVVRMGYKIADAQIERTARFGKRLRGAGDAIAGPESDRQALDATERLVFKALMACLSWLEGVAADGDNPLRRLASAEFKFVGSLLGLLPTEAAERSQKSPRHPAAATHPGAASHSAASTPPRDTTTSTRPLGVKLTAERRAVRVRHWELSATAVGDYRLIFYHDDSASVIEGSVTIADNLAGLLTIGVHKETPRGAWKAAICDHDGLQLGYIEIEI